MNLKSYLKYTAGIFVGIIALYWIQFNLLPIPDAPTGLNIADFGLIAGVAFWIERTIKFMLGLNKKSKSKSSDKPKEVIAESNEKDGEQIVRNFTAVILIFLALMLFVNIVSF